MRTNIQKYREFIKGHEEKISKYKKDILLLAKNEIIPGIKDILDSYDEEYDKITVNIRDIEDNIIDINNWDPDDLDHYSIDINFYGNYGHLPFDDRVKIIHRETYKEVANRILSEFGDDLDLNMWDRHQLSFTIK